MSPKAPSELKSFILHIRFTSAQRDLLLSVAQHEDRELVDWARRLLLKEASKIKERIEAKSAVRTEQAGTAGRRRLKVD